MTGSSATSGQRATVLQLPVTSPVTASEAQRDGSMVA
jgi:hypothetical protein